jgi:hypothetical protein
VIKEIAWRWREIGADGRICDLLDSQVSAIEGACGQISTAAPKDALSAAFDLIEQRIAAFGDGDRPAAQAAEQASPSPAPAASVETPAAAETGQAATATDTVEAAIGPAAVPEETVSPVEAVDMAAEAAPVEEIVASVEMVDAAAEAVEVAQITAEASDAHDEALLELVAFEMSAPDFSDIDEAEPDADEIRVAELAPAESVMVAPEPELMVAPEPELMAAPESEPVAAPAQPSAIQPSLQPSLEPQPEPSREPSPKPSHEHSLGSSLIASGILRRSHSAASDPLAAIRRLSQAEKIALFS